MSNSVSRFATRDVGGLADKVDLMRDAYSQLRISGLTVDPTTEDLEISLWRMENMLAEWQPRMDLGYNFEDQPDPNSPSNLRRPYWHGIATNLAKRLIPDFNKAVPQELINQASQSYSAISGMYAKERINEVNYPTRMPQGSGNTLKYNRWARFYRLSDPFTNTTNLTEAFKGNINDFVEHYDAYLNEGETIDTYTITADVGLDLVSDTNTDDEIQYRLKFTGSDERDVNSVRQVTIVMTTTSGRVETRYRLFEIYSE